MNISVIRSFYFTALLSMGVFVSPNSLLSQSQSLSTNAPLLNVFIDCVEFDCDSDYILENLTWVRHVRARQDSDIHVLLTNEETGNGGVQYLLKFIGFNKYSTVDNTLSYYAQPAQSEETTRIELLNVLQLGLVQVPGVLNSNQFKMVFDIEPLVKDSTENTKDPWNAWTFNLGLNGELSGDDNYRNKEVFFSSSAGRVTENAKIELGADVNRYSQSFKYSVDDVERESSSENNFYNVYGLLVKGIGSNFSLGALGEVNSATYMNREIMVRLVPAIEYNFFPYSEYNNKRLTVLYAAGPEWNKYYETTIYGKDEEFINKQTLSTSLMLRQPWGTAHFNVQGSSYFHDFSQNRIRSRIGADINLFKGFSLEIGAFAERIRDQINLSAAELDEEDVLLKQRELATGFSYNTSIGISYTFGSSLAGIVNPRFGRGIP